MNKLSKWFIIGLMIFWLIPASGVNAEDTIWVPTREFAMKYSEFVVELKSALLFEMMTKQIPDNRRDIALSERDGETSMVIRPLGEDKIIFKTNALKVATQNSGSQEIKQEAEAAAKAIVAYSK